VACLPPLLLPAELDELPDVPVLRPAVVLVEPEWPKAPPEPPLVSSVSSVLEPPHATIAARANEIVPGQMKRRALGRVVPMNVVVERASAMPPTWRLPPVFLMS
jgi:hypothetical protein